MINWGALGLVGLVSLAVGVIVVVLVATALVGLSARELAEGETDVSPDGGASATIDGTPPVGLATGPAMSEGAGTAVAAVCLLAVVAIVIYGLSLIIFHH
ncbi:MAG TPA: hypothetical protein VGE11_02870 [Pseudonocardia sp.]